MRERVMVRKAYLLIVATCVLGAFGLAHRSMGAVSARGAEGEPALPPNMLPTAQAVARLQAERDRFWLNAKREVDRSVLELQAQHKVELQQGLRLDKLFRGNPAEKTIALTFDDGPHPGFTPRILDILRRYRVKATFFLVGEMAERYPDLVRAEIAQGHSLGNHTYHHVSLIKIPDQDIALEIQSCGDVLRAITGKPLRFFRPPGGEYDRDVARAAEALGYTMVLWTDDPGDYSSPGERAILTRTLGKVRNGGIILLHDGIEQTVEALPSMIEYLQKRGYRFVTVGDLMARRRPLATVG